MQIASDLAVLDMPTPGRARRKVAWLLAFVFFFEFGDINSFSFAAPAILTAWGLKLSTISAVMSATFVGMFVGAVAAGHVSDRIGRKKALIVATVWFSAASLLNAFVWEPVGLFVTRLLTGIGTSAMTVIGVTYISEIFPERRRGTYQAWILAAGLAGIPATAYVARFCIPLAPWAWRLVFVWGSIGLLFPFLARQLEESPRWTEIHRQVRVASANLSQSPLSANNEISNQAFDSPPSGATQQPHILFTRRYMGRTLLFVLVWVLQTLGFYGFTSWVPILLVARGVPLVQTLTWSSGMQVGAVPGALIGAMISDRWQRKWWIVLVALATAGFGVAYGSAHRSSDVIVFGFAVVLLIHIFAALLYSYTAECYPTEIRSSGTGLAYGIGRIANVFGPLLVTSLFNQYGYRSVFLYVGTCWLAVSLAVGLFGPSVEKRTPLL